MNSANNPIRPTLFIGLGGTGKEVLLRLRRRFYERFRVPGLPCTSYLWIDTDIRDVGARGDRLDEAFAAVGFKESERVALLSGTVGESVGDIFANRERWAYIHDWLYDEVERYGTEIKDGAGGVRAVGRLTFFWNYRDLNVAISRELTRLTTQESIHETMDFYRQHGFGGATLDDSAQPLVILVSSIAGGTGGGTFLDTAFLLKELGSHVVQVSQTFSYIFLPNVYYADSKSGELAGRSFANAYASLKELDHYSLRMPSDRAADGGGLHIDYLVEWELRKKLRVMGPPVSATYLLEMCNEGGVSLSLENRRELFGMLAESLFLDLLPGAFATSKRSDYSNITQQLSGAAGANSTSQEVVLTQSFSRRYATCGLSKIEIPVDALRASCAAQLGCDIASQYILRENDDPNVKREVRTDLATYKLDREGIPDSYDIQWKDTIHNETLATFRNMPIRDEGSIGELEQKLAGLDKKLIYSEGADKTRWGDVIKYLRSKTGGVTEDGKKRFFELLRDRCLENEGRGLQSTLRSGGYLEQVIAETRDLSAPPDAGVKAYFDQEAEAAEADAVAWEEKRTLLIQEIRAALGSMTAAMLGLKPWTIGKLVERLQDAQEQAVRCRAFVCLYRESKKCAETLVKTLSEQRARLEKFQQFAQNLAATQRGRAIEFRTIQRETQVLMFRLYDEKNWDAFYRLDKDEENGELKAVNPQREYRRLLDTCFGSDSNLMELVVSMERDGKSELEKRIVNFCEDRFWMDFSTNRRAVDILDHPLMTERRTEYLQKLVNAARPMLRQSGRMGAAFVNAPRFAYLGIADPSIEPYRQVVSDVKRLVEAIPGYNYQLQPHATNNPSEIYLYLSNYAYALPSLPLVSKDAHDAYWDFYMNLNENSQGKGASQIPLHLSKRWEGKFDDLVVYSGEAAKVLRDIYYILLFGQMLKILTLKDQKGLQLYQYKLGAPFSKMAPLGPRRQVIATLQRDQDLRTLLLNATNSRENSLNAEQVVSYYWAIQASLNSPDLIPNTPEATLLTQKLDKDKGGGAYERALAAVADPSALRLDNISEADRFDWIKNLESAGLEWFADSFPSVKNIDVWAKQSTRTDV